MDEIKIELLKEDTIDNLFEFEKENRDYFKEISMARTEDFYDKKSFDELAKKCIEASKNDEKYNYLILNKDNIVVGIINIYDIDRENLQVAEIGYRIGKCHQRKGYATKAVELILKEAFYTHNLHRIEARTTTTNIGSQIVLIKNGFQFVGKATEFMFVDGKWQDYVMLEKITFKNE